MLADEFIQWQGSKEYNYDLIARTYGKGVAAALGHTGLAVQDGKTQRFALSPQIAELTAQLSSSKKSFKSLCENVALPHERTWIEFAVADAAGYITNESDVHRGYGETVQRKIKRIGILLDGFETRKEEPPIYAAMTTVVINTDQNEVGFATAFNLHFEAGDVSFETGRSFNAKDVPMYCAFIVAACSVINTPRIFDTRKVDFEALNKRREEKGKEPLMSYSEVIMPKALADGLRASRDAMHGKRKYHPVHTFVRVKNGRVEIVRPHWRGDPALGVAGSSTTVRRAGEHVKRPEARVLTR